LCKIYYFIAQFLFRWYNHFKGGEVLEENKFCEKLKELRNYHGLSQKELSELIGIPYNSIIKYETGDRRPNFNTLKRFAEFYNTSIDYMMGFTDYLLDKCSENFISELIESNAKKVLHNLSHVYSIDSSDLNINADKKLKNKELYVNSYIMFFGILVNLIDLEDDSKNYFSKEDLMKLNLICKILFQLLEILKLESFDIDELSSLSLLIDECIKGGFSFKSRVDLDTLDTKQIKSKEERIKLLETYININNTNNQKALRLLKELVEE
jgi:transcriptional regulator with XRE-family HTH domain